MTVFELPNKFFYYVAKEVLRQCYSKGVAESFYSFSIEKAGRFKKNNVKVKCFNGGAFISLFLSMEEIKKAGDYAKCKRYNGKQIVKKALENINLIPNYYTVEFSEGIDCNQRCVSDIEKAKLDCIRYWESSHSKITEPITWFIKEV